MDWNYFIGRDSVVPKLYLLKYFVIFITWVIGVLLLRYYHRGHLNVTNSIQTNNFRIAECIGVRSSYYTKKH